ncbi:hypothetical protein J2W25_001851 [Variovorax boronicumulans]|uniref:Uncharacterized protein n=1 Tax=Variovorax boronicumulans TaxID=436515 RepID=A0AAW8DTE1_9BURK|nr:hypothetical protein [Variovorax boronicumulans]MDP9922830.1 hypothetical protein [Variovorax boronicumulans]
MTAREVDGRIALGVDIGGALRVGELSHEGRIVQVRPRGIVEVEVAQAAFVERTAAPVRTGDVHGDPRLMEHVPEVRQLGQPQPGLVLATGIVRVIGDDDQHALLGSSRTGHGCFLEGVGLRPPLQRKREERRREQGHPGFQ